MKKKRIAAIVCSFLLAAGSIISLFETVYSGDPDIDPAWDTAEGTIMTNDGSVICECKDDNHRGTVNEPEIYGPLLGYNSEGFGRSGLRSKLMDKLYATDDKKSAQGNSITLTLNSSVQTFAYNLMLPFSKIGKDTNACAVCIENKTGRILGLVSIKAPLKTAENETIIYDVNNISTFCQKTEQTKTEIPDAYYLPEWALAKTPGSVFKCISAIPIIENGLDNEPVCDKGSILISSDIKISNYHNYSYGEISLADGLKYSSNCYFSSMYNNNLSKGNLSEMFDRCLLGSPLELDFVSLKSNVNLSNQSSYIMSSFGQITVVTPLQTCSLLSGICSGTGVVKTPYLIEKETTPEGKSKVKGKPGTLTGITDKETASKLCEYLQATAAHYGYDGVYMKTGTAEIADGVQNYCFCGNKEYTVLISVHNFADTSTELTGAAHSLLKYTTSASLSREEVHDAYADASESEHKNRFEKFIHLFSKKDDVPEKGSSSEKKSSGISTLVDFFKS